MRLPNRPTNITGPEGLLASVILRGVKDAVGDQKRHKVTARRYFAGAMFTADLELLDLPADAWPGRFTDE